MTTETIVLGAGCFWCAEAVFSSLRGVSAVRSGYAGGTTPDPTYEQVCTGRTGHAEVVQITFDPDVISLAQILRVFFTMHNPTTLNRQGNDTGTQYRSVIFTDSPEQAATARQILRETEDSNIWGAPLVTQTEPLTTFWPAETTHEDYLARNPSNPYCQAVVLPKVLKMRQTFADLQK